MSDPVLLRREGAIATITLNRPAVLNALSRDMATGLARATGIVEHDPAIRAVILCGAGAGFMAGGDLGEIAREAERHSDPGSRRAEVEQLVHVAHASILQLRRMPKPVIAAVHGACAGYGVSLLLAADLAIAAEGTKFTLAYCQVGLSPDGGGSYHLPRIVGAKRAAELLFTGDRFDSADALAWGLVNRVTAADQLEATVQALAGRLAAGPTQAYARAKQLLTMSTENTLERQLQMEAERFAASTLTEDFAEGVAAFLGKRPPVFQGR